MTITPHLLVGSAIAEGTPNIYLGLILAFFSHLVLDALPHLDPGTFHNITLPGYAKKVAYETIHDENPPWPLWIYIFAVLEFIIIAGLVILFFHISQKFIPILLGGLAGILIDILDNPVFAFILNVPGIKQIHYLHHRIHYNLAKEKWYWGLVSEIIILGGTVWFLWKNS